MGLENKEGRKIYLTISDGKLVRQHQNPIEGVTVERVNKNGKTVHEEFHAALAASITNISSKETTFGKVWEIELVDGDDTFVLSFNYSSRYTNHFFRTLPNVDLSAPVRLAPWAMKDKKDPAKTVTGITIYQGGIKIPFAYDRENPGDMPDLKQVKRKGKLEWDDTDQLDFFESMLKNKILPQLNSKKYQVVAETVTATDETEEEYNDEMPF